MKKTHDAFSPGEGKLIVPRGAGGGKGGGGGGSTEDPTSLQSNQIVSLVDLLCEGPIQGFEQPGTWNSLFLSDSGSTGFTPVTNADGSFNFQGLVINYQLGYPNQPPMPGFSDAENVFQINQKILHAIPQTVTLSASAVDAVVLTIGVQGLLTTDTKTGDIHGTNVSFHVDIKPYNGAWSTAFADTIDGKTNSAYSRDYRLELPQAQGPWQVRVTRDTADSTTTTLVNDLYFLAYTEIGELNLSYPYSVVVGWNVSAQQFGSSIPARAYRVKGMIVNVPSNYDPVTRNYSGAYWDGTFKAAWTDNPAWVLFDILISPRYGLGRRIDVSLIDKYSLYAIAQYCDQYVPDGFGGYEPRFRFNGVLSNRSDAYSVLQSIASTLRGMIYWSAGAVTFTQDSPKAVKKLFNPTNVIDGTFTYQSTALKDRHSVARVTWNDPNNHYAQTLEVVENQQALQRFGWRTVDIQAIGTTSRGQAHRIGKWVLDTEFSESETVTFTCSLQEADMMPGDLIDIIDPAIAGVRLGGRIASHNGGTLVTLDAATTLYGGDNLMVIAPDGVTVWQIPCGSADGLNPTKNLSLSYPPSATINPGAVFLISSNAVSPRQYRVTGIQESAANTWEVTALFYDPTKFLRIEDNINLAQPNYSVLPNGPVSPPSNVVVKESLFQMNGSIISRLIVSWTPSSDARVSGYDIFAASPGGNMQWYGRSTVSSFDIDTAQLGGWTFNIYSNSLYGDSYAPAVAYYDVLGKNLPPSDVQNVGYTFDPTIGVVLTWAPVDDVDLSLYEVRKVNQFGNNWGTMTYLGQVKGSTFTLPPGSTNGGSGTYAVCALSVMGNYSAHPAEAAVVVPAADAAVLRAACVGTDCVFSWNTPPSPFAINYYELRTDTDFGDLSDPDAMLGQVKGNTFKVKAQWGGARDFYISAFDTAGDYGGTGQVTVTVVLPSLPVIIAQVIDNNVLLRWTITAGTLPIDHYEVRKGAAWASAQVVGQTSGTFDVLFETSAGNYTYWIAGVDSAGNYGPPAQISATVSQPPDYILLYNQDSTFGGTLTNALVDGDGGLVMPVDVTSTFEQHFTNNRVISASNLDLQSWGHVNCAIAQGIDDPNGNNLGYTMTTSASGNDYIFKSSVPCTPGQPFTFSIDMRRRAGQGSGTVKLFIRSTDGATTYLGAEQTVTASWARYSATIPSVAAGVTALQLFVDPSTDTGNAGFVLDVWGPQVVNDVAPQYYWGSPQDQIGAGLPLFIQPGMTSAVYSESIDYGTHLPSTKFTVTPTSQIIAGAPNLQCDIQTSLDGVTWTDFPDTFQTFVQNFRYAKITLTCTGNGGDLIKLNNLNIRFDVKQKTDGGIVQCSATDTNGTPVVFATEFIDVQSITLTGQGTVAAFAIYDFVDAPYPTGFTAYLFDKNGNRVTGNASWAARGV